MVKFSGPFPYKKAKEYQVNLITLVGSSKPYDKNPNKARKNIGMARIHGLPVQLVQEAIGRISSSKFSIERNVSSQLHGLVVNVYCAKSKVTAEEIENFFEELNLILGAVQTARQTARDIGDSRSTRGNKPRPVRVASQRRTG